MSGEGGGIVIGGILLIAGLPYILAGAAIIGVAAGAVALGRVGINAAIEHHKSKQFEIDNCSTELQHLYGQMQSAMNQQHQQELAFYQRLDQQMTAFSRSMETAAQTLKDTSRMEQELRSARTACAKAMGETREKELKRIQTETKAECAKISRSVEETMKTRAALADWTQRTEAAAANQKAVAQSLLRDAAATSRMLENLSASSGDRAFVQQAQAMVRSYQSAKTALDSGLYQMAAATAQQVISRGAALAMDNAMKTAETDSVRVALIAQLEALKEELETQCVLTFRDEVFGERQEYLDEFTQGEFERVQNEVKDMLARARTEQSPAMLEQMLRQTEQVLIPNANLVVDTGHDKLRRYYERMHTMQVIKQYIESQGYRSDWAAPQGEDVTQKLVMRFQNSVTGNTISVALDEDSDPENVGRMAMEVMFYYANGRPVTEQEKQRIRDGISNALEKKGLKSRLGCTGSVNQPAANQTLNDFNAVIRTKPQKIFETR